MSFVTVTGGASSTPSFVEYLCSLGSWPGLTISSAKCSDSEGEWPEACDSRRALARRSLPCWKVGVRKRFGFLTSVWRTGGPVSVSSGFDFEPKHIFERRMLAFMCVVVIFQ
jgi:hypothetical protein